MILIKLPGRGSEIKQMHLLRYYKKIINSNNNSSKQFWKTFGNILNKNKKHHKKIVNLNIDNRIINDNQKITESFYDFFCQIGTNLASKFSNNDKSILTLI